MGVSPTRISYFSIFKLQLYNKWATLTFLILHGEYRAVQFFCTCGVALSIRTNILDHLTWKMSNGETKMVANNKRICPSHSQVMGEMTLKLFQLTAGYQIRTVQFFPFLFEKKTSKFHFNTKFFLSWRCDLPRTLLPLNKKVSFFFRKV